jgi:hypothetical protein
MKHRFGVERAERKALKAVGKWPKKVHDNKNFKCEEVLADASLAVQDLLHRAKDTKLKRNMIPMIRRTRQPYTKLSDAKTKTKSIMMHSLAKKEE